MKLTTVILKKFGWSVGKSPMTPKVKCYYNPDGVYTFEEPTLEKIALSLGLKYRKFPGPKRKPDTFSPNGYYDGYWVDAAGTSLGGDLEAILKRVIRGRA